MTLPDDYDWSRHFFPGDNDQEALAPDPDGVVCLADVRQETVRWLWKGRIPLGKITVIQGDPGLGKSTITMDLAARISRGAPMPDNTFGLDESAGVLILGAEDGLADTIQPRLAAAGADMGRVFAQTWVGRPDRAPVIPGDLDALAATIQRHNVALVIIDPMMAYLGSDVGSNNNQDIRRALAPVKAMAEALDVAVVFVHHLNKGNGPAMYRGGGSIGINAAARSVLVVAKDPDESNPRFILAAVKSNLAKMAPSMAYVLNDSAYDCALVSWSGSTDHTAEEILAPRFPKGEEDTGPIYAAQRFLINALSGGPVAANDIKKMAADDDISLITLKRAKASLGVASQRDSFGPGSVVRWVLPDHRESPAPIGAHLQGESPYAENDPLWDEDLAERATDDDAEVDL